jgi:SNF2 family DNA or RNA helicase
MDYPFKTVPYAHQITALEKSWSKENYAYFMEMGTGKSKVLIDNMSMLYDKGKINGALIIAPKGVYRNWQRQEIPIHLPSHIEDFTVVWTPTPNKLEKELLESIIKDPKDLTLDIFLMNVEALHTMKGARFAERFLNGHRALLVIDESTTIKNPKAMRTKNALKLSTLAKYRRILTGSPVTKDPIDLFSQCEFLDPAILGHSSYYSFKNRYTIQVQTNVGTHVFNKVVGYQNLEELSGLLEPHSYRVLKTDCLDLPEKIYTKRQVDLTDEQKKAYGEMKEYSLTLFDNGEVLTASTVMTQLLRLHQISCGHLITASGETKIFKNNRITELMGILEETDGKVIIWANYRQDIRTIYDTISKKHGEETVATYYGDTPDNERQDIVLKFQDTKSPLRFFVGNQQTAGYGLTLTAASTVVYYSNNYDLEKRIQSEDRAHRIGQKNNVTYIDLIAEKTVDERIVKALRNKINIASIVLGEDFKQWLT